MNLKCSKCGSQMTKGFTMELPTGRQAVTTWVEGEIEKSFWTGIKFTKKRQIPLITYCCEKCGFLEAYGDLTKQKNHS